MNRYRLLVLLLGSLGALTLSQCGGAKGKAAEMHNYKILKDHAEAAINTIGDDGSFPASLDAVRQQSSTVSADSKLINPATGEKVDPKYHTGLTTASAKESILFSCPFNHSSGKRVVAFRDASVKGVTEAEFKKKIAGQK